MIEVNKEYFFLFPRSGRSNTRISTSLTAQTTLLPIKYCQGGRLIKGEVH